MFFTIAFPPAKHFEFNPFNSPRKLIQMQHNIRQVSKDVAYKGVQEKKALSVLGFSALLVRIIDLIQKRLSLQIAIGQLPRKIVSRELITGWLG
ncbi:hypothetical protein AVEN_141568-1 [Araneus ventricosus]|uniref:Uncharacterized protein n=1 Tax=Araneus ventricosus TaxID=182803 RepID=A0A4Y2U2M5_ARAVE|nr:hypothetical protein AVEN_141568-1 [Araneus ventricosus]